MELLRTFKKPWRARLRAHCLGSPAGELSPRVTVLGFGSDLRGDDAAGLLAARALLRGPGLPGRWQVLEGGRAPENFTGAVRRFAPQRVLLVDAFEGGLPPGTVRFFETVQAGLDLTAVTHVFSPLLLAEYLERELGCAVALLGIQAGSMAFGAPVSPAVRRAVGRVAGALRGVG